MKEHREALKQGYGYRAGGDDTQPARVRAAQLCVRNDCALSNSF